MVRPHYGASLLVARTLTEMIQPQISEADATMVDVYGLKSQTADQLLDPQLVEWEKKGWFGQTYDRAKVAAKTLLGGLTDKEVEELKPAIRSITKDPLLAMSGSLVYGIPAILGLSEEYEGQTYGGRTGDMLDRLIQEGKGYEGEIAKSPNLLDMYYGYEEIPFKEVSEERRPKETYDWAKDLPMYDITDELTVTGMPASVMLQHMFDNFSDKDWDKVVDKVKFNNDIFQMKDHTDEADKVASKGTGDLAKSKSQGAKLANLFTTDMDLGTSFSFTIGQDDNGRSYVSIYDTFDFKAPESWSKKGFDVVDRAGTPMQLYGRWYLDEFKDIPKYAK